MAELATLARPYAKAAFKFAKEQKASRQWSNMLAFSAAAINDVDVASILDNPQLTADQQAETFIRVCGDQLDDSGKNFIRQLTQNKRLTVLPQIAILYEALLAEEERKQDVELVSAYALSAEEENSLKSSLEKKLGKEINLQSRIDKALIGGVIVRAGDMVIDGSVRGKLQQLSQHLK
jgi:F-type H+-transporting ATPase subunit delta